MTFYLQQHRNPHGPHYYEARKEPVLAIVMHVTAGLQGRPDRADTSAEQTAKYAASTERKVSWHSSSDTDSFFQLLPDSATAFHCQGYNSCTVGHEISKRDVSWTDESPKWVAETLDMAAACLRGRAAKLRVPVRRASRSELDAAREHFRRTGLARPVGFLAHGDLDPERRRDPGPDFPWTRFLALFGTPAAPDSKEFSVMDKETRAYLDARFGALEGGPRRPDRTDSDPRTISLADVYTLVEKIDKRLTALEGKG